MITPEIVKSSRTLERIFKDIAAAEPRPIKASVASNANEQKQAFLDNTIRNPHFMYEELSSINFESERMKLQLLFEEISSHPEIPHKILPIYSDFIERYLNILNLMEHANEFNLSEDENEKALHRDAFMSLNRELYGEPDQVTFLGLLGEKISTIDVDSLDEIGKNVFNELIDLLPEDVTLDSSLERYHPDAQTVSELQEIALTLYGSLLRHIDENKSEYLAEETRELFEEIVREEFGESAIEWRVVLDDSTSINVSASEKLIKIPKDRKPIGTQEMRGLVAHEIGVHFMRAIMGGNTDILPLGLGFADFYDAEEGCGKVMEQAVKGKFVDSGIPYYIVSGLMNNGADFRTAHDIMWRFSVLEKASKGAHITDGMSEAAQEASYKTVLRIARLTNGLPWFKDLSYYKGSISMWRFMSENMHDFERFITVFYGKIDPANADHERNAYEAHSV